VETGRVINRRYLLQRLIKQGQVCAIYQGMDQVLQRVVAVKAVPAAHIPAYRAALKMTANFSHPNVVGTYDLIMEPETLYIVQEYIEGLDFSALLQTQLSFYDVADLGMQICQALMYADNTLHSLCHGDLTPTSILYDIYGLIRVNNFALPSDLRYFQKWSNMGGDGIVVSDAELPFGEQSEARRSDDTRAAGLLLYQLLSGRTSGAAFSEPPLDGHLRFQRNVPPDLCETVARAIVRQHPNHINTPEALYVELKTVSEMLPQVMPVVVPANSPAYQQREEPLVISQSPMPGGGKLATALPARDTERPGSSLSSYRSEQGARPAVEEITPASPTVADVHRRLVAARQAAYPASGVQRRGLSPAFMILLIGLIVFVLLFIVGYLAGQFIIH
jgi:eukaryotic-like serine/threonine-protein kinase